MIVRKNCSAQPVADAKPPQPAGSQHFGRSRQPSGGSLVCGCLHAASLIVYVLLHCAQRAHAWAAAASLRVAARAPPRTTRSAPLPAPIRQPATRTKTQNRTTPRPSRGRQAYARTCSCRRVWSTRAAPSEEHLGSSPPRAYERNPRTRVRASNSPNQEVVARSCAPRHSSLPLT